MSQIKVDDIVNAAGTGAPSFSFGAQVFQPLVNLADADATLVGTEGRSFKMTMASASRAIKLPSVGVIAGDSFSFLNLSGPSTAFDINVNAADNSPIGFALPGGSRLEIVAKTASPATSSGWAASIPKNRWQKKYLQANVTTGSPAYPADLGFTGLTIGKTYKLTIQSQTSIADNRSDSTLRQVMRSFNAASVGGTGAIICQCGFEDSINTVTFGNNIGWYFSSSSIFVATLPAVSTVLLTPTSNVGINMLFYAQGTNVLLEELNNYAATTSW